MTTRRPNIPASGTIPWCCRRVTRNSQLNPYDEGKRIMMMNRRTFSAALVAGAAASLISTKRTTAASTAPVKARNVVLVHGLFADGSCWSEVIAGLQAAGLNATAVQN